MLFDPLWLLQDEEIDADDELLASRGMTDDAALPSAPGGATSQEPEVEPAPAVAAVPPTNAQQTSTLTRNIDATVPRPASSAREEPSMVPVEDLLYHTSDSSVKPIVMNRRIEKGIDQPVRQAIDCCSCRYS